MPYSSIVIPVDEDEPITRIVLGDGLAEKQAVVHGFIQAIDFETFPGVTFYINEEGKFTEPVNPRATALLGPGLFAGDAINGPLLICAWEFETDTYSDMPEGWEDDHLPPAPRLLPEAEIEHTAGKRSITYLWKLYEKDDGAVEYATLHCAHHTAGVSMMSGKTHPNEFFAVLQQETREDHGTYTMRGLTLGAGTGILYRPVTRYSEKGLEAFAKEALAALLAHYAVSDPRVTRHFPAAAAMAGAL
jgi:hypothetical protein